MASVTARRAGSEDRERIADLASSATRAVLQIPWRDLESRPSQPGRGRADFYVAQVGDRLVCACGVVIGPPDVAYIRVFVLLDAWPVGQAMDAVMPQVAAELSEKGVTTLAFIGVEEWFVDGLRAFGFGRVNSVRTLQKTEFLIPDQGNQDVVVRQVTPTDYASIVAIDLLAFGPLWRNTIAMLDEYGHTHPYFVVAEHAGLVVGYALADLQGRHGHLTRLAVHPDHQGQRIGIRLLGEVIRFMRKRRVFGLTLNTQQDNVRSRRLYTWFGFAPLGRDADVLVRLLPS